MIRTGTPWMREALRQADPDRITEVGALIPEGHHIAIFCAGKPRPLGAMLVRGNEVVARVEPAYYSVEAACHAVLRKAEPMVVEDHESFVVTADIGD